MQILNNPVFLTRLAGVIALAVTLYFPGVAEDRIVGFIAALLTFVAGKFEKQPEVAKAPEERAVSQKGAK